MFKCISCINELTKKLSGEVKDKQKRSNVNRINSQIADFVRTNSFTSNEYM